MALRAIRDTYAFEEVTGVRRLVKTGSELPPHYVDYDEDDIQDDGSAHSLIVGARPAPVPLVVEPQKKVAKK